MPWKQIKKHSYYYKHTRESGKFRSEYVGSGELAERLAEMDRRATQARREAAAARRARREEMDAADRIQASAFANVGIVVLMALEACGFHRHKRGQWRRRRMSEEIVQQPTPTMPGTPGELNDTIARAMAGDASALPMLREMFDAQPARMLAAADASLSFGIHWPAIARIAGDNLFMTESLPRQMEALRKELAGPKPSPIERLLAERVAWSDCPSDALEEHAHKMRSRAEKRYLLAITTLAQVRKLGVIAVQVNIESSRSTSAVATGPQPDGPRCQGPAWPLHRATRPITIDQ